MSVWETCRKINIHGRWTGEEKRNLRHVNTFRVSKLFLTYDSCFLCDMPWLWLECYPTNSQNRSFQLHERRRKINNLAKDTTSTKSKSWQHSVLGERLNIQETEANSRQRKVTSYKLWTRFPIKGSKFCLSLLATEIGFLWSSFWIGKFSNSPNQNISQAWNNFIRITRSTFPVSSEFSPNFSWSKVEIFHLKSFVFTHRLDFMRNEILVSSWITLCKLWTMVNWKS